MYVETIYLLDVHFNALLAIYLIAPFTDSPFMRGVHLRAGACILRWSPKRRYFLRFISCRFFLSHLALSVAEIGRSQRDPRARIHSFFPLRSNLPPLFSPLVASSGFLLFSTPGRAFSNSPDDVSAFEDRKFPLSLVEHYRSSGSSRR